MYSEYVIKKNNTEDADKNVKTIISTGLDEINIVEWNIESISH